MLCFACAHSIQFNVPPFCVKCSRHLNKFIRESYCQECHTSKPAFDFAWGACLYNETLQNLLHAFKYEQKTLLRHFLVEQMTSFIETYHLDIHQFDVMVAIPLSTTRLRERGYNQSHLLAQGLSWHYGIPLADHLIRVKHTTSQVTLNRKERWTNLTGAFKIKHSFDFFEKNVLIIDDLLTTGATASEAASTLKAAGTKTVGVLTLAIV